MENSEPQNRRSRRGRQAKAARKISAAFESGKLEKQVTLELVNGSQAQMIHTAVKKILWEVGVIVEHKASCQQMLHHKDCWQDDRGYVHFPEDMVEQAILSVPESILLYDHDGNVKVDTASTVTSLLSWPQLCQNPRLSNQ